MKFNKKIFLVTFSLSIISIFIINYLVIKNSNKMNIDKTIENEISQSKTMVQLIKYMNNNLNPLDTPMDITGFINGYINVGAYEYLEILKKDDSSNSIIVFSNVIDSDVNEVIDSIYNDDGKIISKIVNMNGKDLLFICNGSESDYIFVACKDISSIYNINKMNIDLFKKITIISYILIGVILYLFIYLLTRRISNINKALIEFSNGNYKKRLNRFGDDEVGMLANGFNMMSSSIEKNIDDIKEESRNKQDFINNITHELRTPLTSIIGYSSLLVNANMTDKNVEKEYAKKIYDESIYIKNISEKLMNLFMLNNSKQNFEKLNLSELINKVISEIREIVKFENIVIDDNITENIIINGDKDLIKSLVVNIITNAINSYKDNGKIKIMLYGKGSLKITDYGRGINKDDLIRIKEPFYTTNKSRNKNLGGLGLGLTLCYKIIGIHDGEIQINSELGSGTEVIIKFKEEIEYENANKKN